MYIVKITLKYKVALDNNDCVCACDLSGFHGGNNDDNGWWCQVILNFKATYRQFVIKAVLTLGHYKGNIVNHWTLPKATSTNNKHILLHLWVCSIPFLVSVPASMMSPSFVLYNVDHVILIIWCWSCDTDHVMLIMWCWSCDTDHFMLIMWYWSCDADHVIWPYMGKFWSRIK